MKRTSIAQGYVGFESATLIVDVTRFSGPYTGYNESRYWYVEAYTKDNVQIAQEVCRSYDEAISLACHMFAHGVQLTFSSCASFVRG